MLCLNDTHTNLYFFHFSCLFKKILNKNREVGEGILKNVTKHHMWYGGEDKKNKKNLYFREYKMIIIRMKMSPCFFCNLNFFHLGPTYKNCRQLKFYMMEAALIKTYN